MANTSVIHDISIGRSVGFTEHNFSLKRKCSETKSRDILLRYYPRSFKDLHNEQTIMRSALIVLLLNNPQFGYCICELVYDHQFIHTLISITIITRVTMTTLNKHWRMYRLS